MKILDIGCGSKKTRGSIGLDYDINVKPDIVYNLDKFPYPFKNSKFDKIICNHVIEHLENPYKFLQECHRILKNNGIMEIKTPHFSSSWAYALVHKRYFSCMSFFLISDIFNIEKIKLNYLIKHSTYKRNYNFLLRLFSKLIEFAANKNLHFCERFWCYWWGGFSEIDIKLRKK